MRHFTKRALCVFVSISMLLTLASLFTISSTALTTSATAAVSVGNNFMVAQSSTGEVWAWGSNDAKILGIADSTSKTPVKITLPTGVQSVAIRAGYDHVLMLGSDGNVYAWGNNDCGQLGMTTAENYLDAPTLVVGLQGKNVVALAAGKQFSLALTESGAVYAFGLNDKAQLGYIIPDGADSAATKVFTPTRVAALSEVFVTKITAANDFATAIDADGKAYVWGSASHSVLGADNNKDFPMKLPDAKTTETVLATALSETHSVFLLENGTVGFMGLNRNGQYGNGTTDSNPAVKFKPTDVSALKITAVAAMQDQTVLLGMDGKVYTAGKVFGSDEMQTSFTYLFEGMSTTPMAAMIAAGYQNGAFVAKDGSIWTWGDNGFGQLGNNTQGDAQAAPARVCNADGSAFALGTAPHIRDMVLMFKTSVPAPNFTVTIPSTIDVGELRQTSEEDPARLHYADFDVTVENVANLYGEFKIVLTVASGNENGAFYLSDGSVTLPYKLLTAKDATEALESGATLGEFTADGDVKTWICIDQSKILKSGLYSGTLVFDYTVAPIQD